MSVISTSRGNPQASDVAVQTATPMLGGASREDAQTVISSADSEIAKLFEDRNFSLVGGGLITFTGTQLQFTENLTLHVNSQVAGGAPTIISLGSANRALSANNRMLYAVINRSAGTATVTDDATTLAAVAFANQEVVLIGKRVDAGDGTQRFYFRNGSTYNAGQTARLGSSGSGSGSGEINEINNPSDATNWSTSGGGVTVATTTTTSDLPLNGVISTAIKLTPVSGTDYARYRWTMPTALLSKRHKIDWFQHSLAGYTSGDFKVEVYTNSASDYTGTYTELPLYNDVSGTSAIPSGDGRYVNAFDATSTLYYEIRFVRVAGTTALCITNLVIGPGVQPSSPVVETPVAIALTYDNLGTVTTNAANATRTGGRAKVQGRVTTGTIVAGTPAIVLPSGMTINTGSSGLSTDAAGQQVGYVTILAATASDVDQVVQYALFFDGSTTNKLFISERSNTGAFKKHNATDFLANGDVLSFEFDIPVGEWAGSGTLNTGANSVDYLYNSNTSTSASDTTSFAYGSGGASIVAVSSAGSTVKKRVRSQRPMSGTAGKPVLEVSPNGTNWFKAETILAYMESGSERYGMRLVAGGTALTDVDVEFGGDGANGTEAWSVYTSWVWRVTIEQPGVAVGYGLADTSTSGFMSNTSQTLAGAKTWNDIQTWMAAAGSVSAGSYSASGAWTFGPATGGGLTHTFRSGSTGATILRVESTGTNQNSQIQFAGNFTGPTAQTWNVGLNITQSTGAFEFVSSSTLLGSISNTGSWTLGVNDNTANTHVFRGNTAPCVEIRQGSSSAQLKLTRSGSSPGSVFLGTADSDLRFGSTAGGSEYGSISSVGAWTFGSSGIASLNHSFKSNGTVTIDLTAASTSNPAAYNMYQGVTLQASVRSLESASSLAISTGDLGLISYGHNIVFSGDSATTRHGSLTSTGTWTLGSTASSNTHAINANNSAGRVLQVRNHEATTASDNDAALVLIKGSSTNTTSQVLMQFEISGGATGQGQINGTAANTATFGSFSDARLKENIQDLSPQLDKIMALRPVSFDYRGDIPGIAAGYKEGFIAQEIGEIYPDTVAVGKNDYLILSGWSTTEARLVKALQEMKQQFDELKADYNAYKVSH